MKEQLYSILKKLIIKNSIRVNQNELKLQLSSHPSYPSLHALTGVLDHFNIPNLALRLTVNQETLNQLPNAFIANVSNEEGDYLALVEKKKNSISITYDNKKKASVSEATFLEQWNGITVAVEKNDAIEEFKDNTFKKIQKWILYSLSILAALFIIYLSHNAFETTHFILSVLGLIVSVFIVKHELGLQSETTNSLCNLSSKTSCEAVLKSKGATLFSLIKLSDASLVIFSTYTFCWSLFAILNLDNTTAMSIVSLLAFPFILYSFYYQHRVVKQWCPLCLAISAVLALQIGTLFLLETPMYSIAIDAFPILLFAISLVIISSIYSVIKPLLVKQQVLAKLEVEHFTFKRNFSIFNALYREGELLTNTDTFSSELVFGNPNANLEILMVTSPLCYFCKSAHKDIEKILKHLNNKIKIVIRFNVNTAEKESILYKVTSRLLNIYHNQGKIATLKALDTVFANNVDLNNWLENQTQDLHTSYDYILNEQHAWCKTNAINFTPALYINHKPFPKEYNRSDILYFVEDLIEAEFTSNPSNSHIKVS